MFSVQGIVVLVLILAVGPLFWLVVPNRSNADTATKQPSEEREQASSTGYLMGLLGYAIGIGNLWRFPYLVGKNGGGAFVFAYLCCLVLVAIPLFLAELAIGNQLRTSCVGAFRAIHPRWRGLGLSQIVLVFFASTYYNVLIGYAWVYVGGSCLHPAPWAGDADEAEVFWRNKVLNVPEDASTIRGFGGLQWMVCCGLLLTYLLNFFSIAFGRGFLEKVTWLTVLGPVVLLAILLVQALRLPGAGDGIRFYIGKFDWAALLDVDLWSTACSQILFSLSPGFGTAITTSSFTDPKTDVFKTCMIVSLCNSAFSITGGFAIFSILGNLAYRTNVPVVDLAHRAGPGLAFISIADGMASFGDWENMMSVLFFLMLAVLGLDSSFAWIGTLIDSIQDMLMEAGRPVSRVVVTAGVCCVLFLAGLPYCTSSGSFLLDVVDRFAGTHFLLISCFVEGFVFALGYTFQRMEAGMKKATNRGAPGSCFWRYALMVTAPGAAMLLCVSNLVSDIRTPHSGYPAWLLTIGWISLAVCVAVFVSTLAQKGESTLDKEVEPSLDEKDCKPGGSHTGQCGERHV